MTERLEHVYHNSLRFAAALRYDGGHPWCLHFLSLYGSILEFAHAILVSVKNDAAIAIPVLLRAMLEATVDLKNLSEDQAYGYALEANALEQRRKFLNHVLEDDSDTAQLIRNQPDFPRELERINNHLNQTAARAGNRASRKIWARFERAGMSQEYHVTYARLCSHGHNESSALINRHVRSDGNSNAVHFHREMEPGELNGEIGIALALVVNSTVIVHQTLNSDVIADALNMKAEFDRFCEACGRAEHT